MNRNQLLGAITNTFAIAVVFALTMVASASSMDAADNERSVLLTLRVERTGMTIVKVQPRDAKIWRNDPEKPRIVRWWTVNNTQYQEVYWEIRHDTSRADETADYFGEINIECGQTEVSVQPVTVPDSPNARWPYVVNVYGCKDGKKAQKLSTLNPTVVWKD